MNTLRWSTFFVAATLVVSATTLTVATWMALNDEDRYGLDGIDAVFTLTEAPTTASTDELITAIRSEAAKLGVNVYKSWPSQREGTRRTDYYLFEGDASTVLGNPATGSFPSFGGVYVGSLRSGADLTARQILGGYLVQGSAAERDVIAGVLANLGAKVTTAEPPPPLERWAWRVIGGPLGGTVAVAWIAVVLASLNFAVDRMGVGAVRRSTGFGQGSVLARDAAALCGPALAAAAAPTLAIVAYSAIWAGGYRAGAAVAMFPIQAVALVSAAGLALGVQRLSTRRRSIGAIVSGARPFRTVTVVAATAAIVAGVIATSTAVSTLLLTREFELERTLDRFWSSQQDLSVISFSYASLTTDSARIDDTIGFAYRQAEQNGEALLAAGDAIGNGEAANTAPMVIVNSALLRTLRVLSASELASIEKIASSPGGAVTIVPPDSPANVPQVVTQIKDWFAFQGTLPGGTPGVVPTIEVLRDVDVGVVPRFDTATAAAGAMSLSSPVVLVTDASSGLISDNFYATNGAYLNPDALQRELQSSGATDLVTAMPRLPELAALKAANDRADLWASMVALTMMGFVIVAAWTIVCAIYLARQRARNFLLWTTGSSFLATHHRFLVWACAGALVPAVGILLLSPLVIEDAVALFCLAVIGAGVAIVLSLAILGRQHNRAALHDS